EEYLKRYDVSHKYNLKVMWSYLRSSKGVMLAIVLLLLAIEIISFTDNFVFKFLIDKATEFNLGEVSKEQFLQFVMLLLGVYFVLRGILAPIFYFIRIKLFNRLEGDLMSNLEKDSFWHIMTRSYRFHLNKKTGSIISQLTRGVSKIETMLDAFMFHFIPTIFRIALSIGVIVYFDKITAMILGIMIVLFIIIGIYITEKQRKPQNEANYQEDLLKQNVGDVFTNIETVIYFGKEKRTQSYFASISNSLRKARIKFWDYFSWYVMIQTFIIAVGIVAIFYFTFNSFVEGRITLGTIALIYSALFKLLPYLFNMMHGYRMFIRSSVDVSALLEMFKVEKEVLNLPNAKTIKIKEGEINFEHVYFTYPKNEASIKRGKELDTVLKDFDLKIKPNTKVALVGPSGGGKSTVVKLLYRLFDLDEGKITIDGQDIGQVTQESLRNSMSIVTQEPILFDNTIYFNIAYANPKADKKDVWKAMKFAQLDKLMANLPYGERTIVGERGVKLSGGEKQRVSIARAILADKKILVLDEATSALDSATEKEIQRDLEKLMKGRTTIMIAHRLSTIMKANTIVVLDQGKIVEKGSHRELTNKKGGLYQRLWGLQQGGNL
ncbi:MAG: ABC transporter ATP-binding protein/permease, partial [Nanoarchaeota archaeon]|nr:ABC transporter ATP-binding protein/permease [Nanoarchaeota archaeon]